MHSQKDKLESKRGYLTDDFKFFYLKDRKNTQFEFHYHDFNKIIVFISGSVTYLIEGKAYRLKPWDLLLVNSNEVHKPLVDPLEDYERIVIWVNSAFLDKHKSEGCNLLTCFELASSRKHNLLRLPPDLLKSIKYTLVQLQEACVSDEFGSRILKNALFMQFIVQLNRKMLGENQALELNDIQYDERINSIISYINRNLPEDLPIESLAARFYMSKYYLMHKFKEQTGYSIHNYILQKRLILANELLKKGLPASEVCVQSGFRDYSSFVRAFKKIYGLSPRKHYKNLVNIEIDKHF